MLSAAVLCREGGWGVRNYIMMSGANGAASFTSFQALLRPLVLGFIGLAHVALGCLRGRFTIYLLLPQIRQLARPFQLKLCIFNYLRSGSRRELLV